MGAPLSLVAPAREMSMMVGALFGMLILGERVTAWRVMGCAILIGGVVLLGSAKAADSASNAPCPGHGADRVLERSRKRRCRISAVIMQCRKTKAARQN